MLSKALDVLGPDLLQFGSDCFLPCPGAHIAERKGWVEDLLDELHVDARGRQRIWAGTAAAWLGLAADDTPRPEKGPGTVEHGRDDIPDASVHAPRRTAHRAPEDGGMLAPYALWGQGGRWRPLCC